MSRPPVQHYREERNGHYILPPSRPIYVGGRKPGMVQFEVRQSLALTGWCLVGGLLLLLICIGAVHVLEWIGSLVRGWMGGF